MLIVDNDELAVRCQAVRQQPFCAVDTEFVWRQTYLPRLGLIQVAGGDEVFLADPMALTDTQPLADLLADDNCIKVFHACSQDLDVLSRCLGVLPQPIFDSQIAAALCGFGYQIGYAALAEICLGTRISKGQQNSDWCRRPLAPAQLAYAAEEVAQLTKCYEVLVRRLRELGRLAWAHEESAQFGREYLAAAEAPLYCRIRGSERLSAAQLGVLEVLAAWRQSTAERVDKPLPWILKDGTLLRLARGCPDSVKALRNIDGLERHAYRQHAEALVACVGRGREQPVTGAINRPSQKLLRETKSGLRSVGASLEQRAADLRLAPEILSSRQQLESLLVPQLNGSPRLLQGWRWQLVHDLLPDAWSEAGLPAREWPSSLVKTC